jgi:hypothetical protein
MFFVLLIGLCLKKKGEVSSNEPFASVFAQEIVKKKVGKLISLTSRAISLIFSMVFLIEVLASLISAGDLES